MADNEQDASVKARLRKEALDLRIEVHKLSNKLKNLQHARDIEAERIKCRKIIEKISSKTRSHISQAAASFRGLLKEQGKAVEDIEKKINQRYQQDLDSLLAYEGNKRKELQTELRHANKSKEEAITNAVSELESQLSEAKLGRDRSNTTNATLSLRNQVLEGKYKALNQQLHLLSKVERTGVKYSKHLRWRDDDEDCGTTPRISGAAVYKLVYLIIECLYDGVYGVKSDAKIVARALLSNRLFAELMEGSVCVLTGNQIKDYHYSMRLVHRLGVHGEILNKSKELHDYQVKTTMATLTAPIDCTPYGAEMEWLHNNINLSMKALTGGQEKAKVIIGSKGQEGVYFNETKGDYKNRIDKMYPDLPLQIMTSWLSDDLTHAQPTSNDWKEVHVQQEGHTYKRMMGPHLEGVEPGKGRKGSKRICLIGDDSGGPLKIYDPSPEAVARQMIEKDGNTCYAVHVRYKNGPDRHLYNTFKELSPTIADITSFATFIDYKPEGVVEAKKDTCCCPHHMEGSFLIEDLYREQKVKRQGLGGGEIPIGGGGEGGGGGGDNLHGKCGTGEGCQCELCNEGKCREFRYNPFYHFDHDRTMRERSDGFEDIILCPQDQRSSQCYKGECGDCGFDLKFLLAKCPMENSNAPVSVKIKTHETPGKPIPANLDPDHDNEGDNNDDDDGGDDDGGGRGEGGNGEGGIPDGEVLGGRRAMHWRHVKATRAQMWKYASRKMAFFIHHKYIARQQSQANKKCIQDLRPGHAVIQLDFNMNYGFGYLMEAPQQFFIQTQMTILPVVGWMLGRDGKKTCIINYIYISGDTNHSNNFVQYVINDVIQRLASQMESWGVALTHLHIWSDGCAGQFKNRYQMKYIIDCVMKTSLKTDGDSTIRLQQISHNFFASCHGKGPCDSAGAVVKALLRSAMKKGVVIRNTDEAFDYLCDNYTIDIWWDEEGSKEVRNPRVFIMVPLTAVDHDKRPQVTSLEGIKSNHSFLATGLEDQLFMAELSCFCNACLDAKDESYQQSCESIKNGIRCLPTMKSLKTEPERARESRDAREEALNHGKSILKGCEVGDLVLLYFDANERDEWNGWSETNDEPSWAIQGKYKVAEIAMMPDLPLLEPTKRRRTRGDLIDIPLFLMEDIMADSRYGFPLKAICPAAKNNRGYPLWEDCGKEGGCECKHACKIDIDKIVAKVPRMNDLEMVVEKEYEERIRLEGQLVEDTDKMMRVRRKDFGLYYYDPLIPIDINLI